MATTKLTYRDVDYNVEDLPQHIQQIIVCHDEADTKYRQAELDLILASSAKKYLSSDISKFVDAWLNEQNETDAGSASPGAEESVEDTEY